jgi:hypothetical protein
MRWASGGDVAAAPEVDERDDQVAKGREHLVSLPRADCGVVFAKDRIADLGQLSTRQCDRHSRTNSAGLA